ncbi:hypothetical protein BDN70DRAFT_345730 [Pholiota conissans]|uniref:Transmembrane protein n=1 Tax=Pholiota conissans TaxID=109636 RepID=A0A9P5YSR5_9AGAR|nr:hypothetical protein BDN70DRAFT_345730 [Pholiota conissans]
MANTQLRVILDDNAGFIAFGGGQQWTLSTLPQWYQGTSNYPAFAQVSDAFGKMTMAFTGTSVAFIGNTPPQGLSQSATVSIDGEAASVFSYGSTKPPAYIQWYQSPTLSNERHTITVDRMDGTAIDIVLVTVGPNTPLGTNKVFVDNNDPAIQYSGSWAESADGFNAGTLPDGSPIGGSTQRTNAVGDTMTFRFTGTSISVYGIFSWANIGSISMTCTLDGVDATEFYPVTANSPQHVRGDLEASNFLFFNKDNLSAGAHTFVLKITGIENQIFALDYLVYSPSFSTFANMPNLTPVPPADTPSSGSNTSTTTPSGGSNSNTPSGGSSSPKPGDGSSSITTGGGTTLPVSPIPESVTTATVSGVVTIITEAASAQTAIGDNQGNTNKSSSPLGAIVGGIVGGLFVLIFAVFLFFYLRRRQSKGNAPLSAERRLMSHNDNTRSSSTNDSIVPRTFKLWKRGPFCRCYPIPGAYYSHGLCLNI